MAATEDDAINPFHDPVVSNPQRSPPENLNDTLVLDRDASLTLGTDSLVVLGIIPSAKINMLWPCSAPESAPPLVHPPTAIATDTLPPESSPTRAFPYFNILWAELSDFDLTIHHALPVGDSSTVRVSTITYPISKDRHSVAKPWLDSLLTRAYGSSQRQKRIKVLVNPFGGSGSAAKRFQRDIKPIFLAAQCHLEVEHTAYSGHAREIAAKLDIHAFDVVASCSGDGLPHEVFNGLGDKENATEALRRVAVVQLPCGTGNAMSWNLNGTDSPSLAALCIVKGVRTPLDLVSVTQGQPERRTLSFLSQSVGIVAETDLGTENLRWMGDARFTYGFLVRLLGKTVYPCSMSVKVVDDNKASIKSHFQAHRQTSNTHQPSSNPPDSTSSINRDTPTPHNILDDPPTEPSSASNSQPLPSGLPALQYGTINTPLPPSWPPLQPYPTLGNFYSGNMSYMSRSANFFQAALPSDGCQDLICIDGDISRLAAVRSLLAVGNGSFFDMPHVRYRKVDAYRIVPHGSAGADNDAVDATLHADADADADAGWARSSAGRSTKAKEGYISIDGERVPFAPFQVEVHRGLGTVLSRSGSRGYETPDLL